MIVLSSDTNLRAMIMNHESIELRVYPDSKKIPTIGIGYNMTQETARADFAHIGVNYDDALAGRISLTYGQVQSLLTISLARAIADARTVFGELMGVWPVAAQYAVVDMQYTLGLTKFLKFHLFIAAMKVCNYIEAARQVVNSEWGKIEAPTRANFDASLLRGCLGSPTTT